MDNTEKFADHLTCYAPHRAGIITGIADYKRALREAIAVTNSPNGDDYFMDGYEQGLLKAMELIDTVTPK